MKKELLDQCNRWHEEDEFQRIADAVSEVPEEEWDYELVSQLARAYNNLGEYQKALELLESVKAEGETDPLWHFRIGYSLYYLDRDQEAKEEFERTCEMAPEDRDAWYLLACCCELLGEEPRLEIPEAVREEARKDIAVASCRPEVYTEEEMELVEAHISHSFGEYESVFHEIYSPDIHVDICIIPPVPERNYYTLVTMGMGAHRMQVPEELQDAHVDRAELLICLPPDWEITSNEEIWYWPIRLLKVLARMPGEENSWLGWGHTADMGENLADNVSFTGALLASPVAFGAGAGVCPMPDGSEINFYQVLPLYRQEMDYKLSHSSEELLERMGDNIFLPLDIGRKNDCDFSGEKKFAIPGEKIQAVLTDWEGPEGCMATDRILVDGCRVGYMYREEPQADYPDSGWRFLAGDESQEYMDDPENTGVYQLNTICNYDPDILPLLKSPYGTAYFRDENGVLQPEETSFLA